MKMPKMELGKTVENGKSAFTPKCRKQKSLVRKNAEKLFYLLWTIFLLKDKISRLMFNKLFKILTSAELTEYHSYFRNAPKNYLYHNSEMIP